MTSDDDRPAPPISFGIVRERYGDDLFHEAAELLRAQIPYFDPNHDSYYYVYHYMVLVCSILAAGRTPRISNQGMSICDACGGLGVTAQDGCEAVCQHCRGEGDIIKLAIAEEPTIVEQ
jgi:hypothetical protein